MATGSFLMPSVHFDLALFFLRADAAADGRQDVASPSASGSAPSKSRSATCWMNCGMSISTGQPAMHGSFLHWMQRCASSTAMSTG